MLRTLKLPRKSLLKVFTSLLLLYTVFLSVKSLSDTTISQYKLRIENSVKLKFKSFYSNFLSSTLDLDINPYFMKKLQILRTEKLKNDWNGELWELDESKLTPASFQIQIPSYYFDSEIKKPPVQPFDPRLTLSVYLRFLTENPRASAPFHWSDWIDFSKLNKYILNPKKAKCKELFDISNNKDLVGDGVISNLEDYCEDDESSPLGFKITKFTGPQSVENREVLGKAFLYSTAPSPVKLVFLTDNEGSYEIKVKNFHDNDLKYSLLGSNLIPHLIEKNAISQDIDVMEIYKSVLTTAPPTNKGDALTDYKINIPSSSFDVDAEKVIKDLEIKERTLNRIDKNYLNSIRFSVSTDNPPKYFCEAKLPQKFQQNWLGEHYDWRFFNGLTVGKSVQTSALHRLIKNYFSFARQNGIITWVAHGSLLSWYWNGIAFPWDTDIDVQMPISDLHKLGKRFNQSLVIENIGNRKNNFSGMGKYFVDVGSSITHREKGNGNNNIDARFIDIDTGLYIDITGLALTKTPAPSRYDYLIEGDNQKKMIVVSSTEDGKINNRVKNEQLRAFNCRNNHFSLYEELSPLILTAVENQLCYIPSKFLMPLNNEYHVRGLTEKNFKGYIYLNNLRLWIPEGIILNYLEDPLKFVRQHNSTLNNPKAGKTKSADLELNQSKDKRSDKKTITGYDKIMINQLTVDDHLNLLQHNKIFKDFYKTYPFTKFHYNEIMHLTRGDLESSKELLEHYENRFLINKPLEPDLFMTKVVKDEWNYSLEIEKIIKLTQFYEQQ